MKSIIVLVLLFGVISCATKEAPSHAADKEAIRRSIKTSLKDIKTCYQSLPTIGGNLPEGKIVMAWEIVDEGTARNITFKSDTIGNTTLQACMTEAIQKVKFPAPEKGQTFLIDGYPFFLKNSGPVLESK